MPWVRRETLAIPEVHPARRVPLARKVPWGHRGRWVHKARPVIPAVHQGHKVLRGHKAQMDPRVPKAQPDQKGRKVPPDPKEIPEDLQGRPAQTAPQDHKAPKVPWEKSAQLT